MKSQSSKNPLMVIPGIGKSIAQDLNHIGIQTIDDLKDQDPEKLIWC